MLISAKELANNWNVWPKGVLHVGGHLGEEAPDYEELSWLPVIWIEANPVLVGTLTAQLDPSNHSVIEAAVWDENGIALNFNVASNSASSSLLEFGSHSQSYPFITFDYEIPVLTFRLDSLIKESFMPNFVNLDIQGAELRAIKGLGELLQKVDYILTEVNRKQVYLDCDLVTEIDIYLSQFGFVRVLTRWNYLHGWGDAFYIRKDLKDGRKIIQKLKSTKAQVKFYLGTVRAQLGYIRRRILMK